MFQEEITWDLEMISYDLNILEQEYGPVTELSPCMEQSPDLS